jgi:c-di-GMP-binding flagellar brake protein YcgR
MMGKSDKPKTEKRKYPRVVTPVFYKTPDILGPKRRVSDLSLGGVRIYSDERLEVGGRLELKFFLPDGSTVKAAAKVVWIKEMPEGTEAVYDVGMEFVELSEAATEKLKAVLKR